MGDLVQHLGELAPLQLAEDWDNVGLLVGDRGTGVERVMTCLTLTPDSAEEAAAQRAQLVLAHHPLPFKGLKRITSDTPEGRMLLRLVGAGCAIYSAHSAWDSAERGINQRIAEGLGLEGIAPIEPSESDPSLGAGRIGHFPAAITLGELAERAKTFFGISGLHAVGAADRPLRKVAVACGSAGVFLGAARRLGADCLLTGETRFHTCLEAESTGVSMLLPGHYATERFAMEQLADWLRELWPDLEIWASRSERDPLHWI